jgi:hypothetical protein
MAAVLRAALRYGARAVKWVKDNASKILEWINIGQSVEWIISKMKEALGID